MKIISIIGPVLFILYIFMEYDAYAGTSVTFPPAELTPGVTVPDLTSMINDIQEKSDLNGPIIINSFALSNICGYPVGKSNIGSFPHMEAGISLGAGLTNMRYFNKDDPEHSNGSLPGISINPVLHFGVGITERVDVLGKLFVLSKSVINPPVDSSVASFDHFNLLSVGGKIRYNIVQKQTLVPFIFNFGGVTISVGGDLMWAEVKAHGEYSTKLSTMSVDVSGTAMDVDTKFDGTYDARVLYGVFSATSQAVAYVDFMYLFSFYTGLGLTLNIAQFKFIFDGTGNITTTDPSFIASRSTDKIGTMIFESNNMYHPYYFIPAYILGLEINLSVVKLTGETMVNIYNLKDVNVQIGLRVQL